MGRFTLKTAFPAQLIVVAAIIPLLKGLVAVGIILKATEDHQGGRIIRVALEDCQAEEVAPESMIDHPEATEDRRAEEVIAEAMVDHPEATEDRRAEEVIAEAMVIQGMDILVQQVTIQYAIGIRVFANLATKENGTIS